MDFKIDHTVQINCPRSDVWEVLSRPAHLELFHPFCKENKPKTWNEIDAKIDQIQYLNGLIYARKFKVWRKHFFSLDIISKGIAIASVDWLITKSQNETKVQIIIQPKNVYKGIQLFYPFIFYFYLSPKLKQYLFSVLQGLKYYMEHGKDVPKNYFGKHKWYS